MGVGDPVPEDTSPRAPTTSAATSSQLQRDLTSGAGYSISSDSHNRSTQTVSETASGYVENARNRSAEPERHGSNSNREPIHVDINEFSEPKRRKKVQTKNSKNWYRSDEQRQSRTAVTGARVSQGAVNRRNDTQALLGDSSSSSAARPRTNAEAVAAHAQRLLAQEKKLARRSLVSANQPSAATTSSSTDGGNRS